MVVPALTVGGTNSATLAAYAQYGNGNGGSSTGNSTGNSSGNMTSSSGNNSTSSHGNSTGNNNGNHTGQNNQGQNNQGMGQGPGDDVSGHGHNADERMHDYVSEDSQTRHKEHISMNEPTTGAFTANLNYTLTASGNATAISDSSNTKNASITLNLSIWKSTTSVVSMDIINGTLKVGDNSTQIFSGHAYYLANKPRMIIYGFIVDNGMGTPGNSSSSEQSVKLLKLFMSGDGTLPAASSDPALKVSVMSPQSKVASEWFLDMGGQVQRS